MVDDRRAPGFDPPAFPPAHCSQDLDLERVSTSWLGSAEQGAKMSTALKVVQ